MCTIENSDPAEIVYQFVFISQLSDLIQFITLVLYSKIGDELALETFNWQKRRSPETGKIGCGKES